MMVKELQGKELEELPKTEVVAKAQRRQYTAEYKLRILGSGCMSGFRGDPRIAASESGQCGSIHFSTATPPRKEMAIWSLITKESYTKFKE